jgi:phage protein D
MSMSTSTSRQPGIVTDYYAPEFVVLVDGQQLDPTTKGDVLEIQVTLDEHNPASFSLTISDWDDANLTFKYSDSTTFDPGREITIDLGYADRLQRVITGVVNSLSPRFPESSAPVLTVGGQDLMRQMANRKPKPGEKKTYVRMADWQIAQEVARRLRMQANVTQKGPVHDIVVQKNQDDATFLMERAKRIDFEFFISLDAATRRETLNFVERTDGRDSRAIRVFDLEWGQNLINFNPRLNRTNQVKEVTVRGWNPRTKEAISYTARSSDLPNLAAGSRGGPAKASAGTVDVRVSDPVLSVEEAKKLAISRLMERANQYTTGTGRVVGLPQLRPNDNVNLSGLPSRFSGRYHVTKVVHTLGSGGYTTELTVERPFEGASS